MLWMASSPICPVPLPMVEFATANSPKKPRRLFVRSQFVKFIRRSRPTVALPMELEVPEPSLSKYWWTSKAKLLAESVIESVAEALGVPYQLSDQVQAPVHALPGTRIRLVAPVARMALMAA